MYISKYLYYKSRSNLCIYKSTELNSTFIKVLNSKKTKVSVGCIYCPPHVDLDELNECYLSSLLDNL